MKRVENKLKLRSVGKARGRSGLVYDIVGIIPCQCSEGECRGEDCLRLKGKLSLGRDRLQEICLYPNCQRGLED